MDTLNPSLEYHIIQYVFRFTSISISSFALVKLGKSVSFIFRNEMLGMLVCVCVDCISKIKFNIDRTFPYHIYRGGRGVGMPGFGNSFDMQQIWFNHCHTWSHIQTKLFYDLWEFIRIKRKRHGKLRSTRFKKVLLVIDLSYSFWRNT